MSAGRPRRNGRAQPFFDATDDGITALSPILGRFPPLAEFIETDAAPEILPHLRRAESAGQPLDSDAFIETLEGETEREFKQRKRVPKPMTEPKPQQVELSELSPWFAATRADLPSACCPGLCRACLCRDTLCERRARGVAAGTLAADGVGLLYRRGTRADRFVTGSL